MAPLAGWQCGGVNLAATLPAGALHIVASIQVRKENVSTDTGIFSSSSAV